MIQSVCTWYSNPLLLKDECVDGCEIKWSIQEGTEPGHRLIPSGVIHKAIHV